MNSSANKAWVALVLGVLSLINLGWGDSLLGSPGQELAGVVIAILFPLAVWFVPNR
jgi:hypothetical protein